MTKQCPSCGGICKPSGCERENVNQTWWDEPVAKMNYRKWQGLTDDDIAQAMYRADAIITGPMQFNFAREIEAKLKEKNT